MSDIIERLRRLYPRPIEGAKGDLHEAADRIEQLERELASARSQARKEALEELLKDFEALNGARYLLQWMDMGPRPTEKTLRAHCERLQIDPPEECRDVDHVPPKALRTLWIVREVIRAHRSALANEKEG